MSANRVSNCTCTGMVRLARAEPVYIRDIIWDYHDDYPAQLNCGVEKDINYKMECYSTGIEIAGECGGLSNSTFLLVVICISLAIIGTLAFVLTKTRKTNHRLNNTITELHEMHPNNQQSS